jgi:hypothetical protein
MTVAEPVALGVPPIGCFGVPGCENCPQATAHVKTKAHRRRAAVAPFQGDAGTQSHRVPFRVAKARIKNIRRLIARIVSGRPGEGAKGAPGGRR